MKEFIETITKKHGNYEDFVNVNDDADHVNIETSEQIWANKEFQTAPHEIKDFIGRLLCKDYNERLSAEDALNHEWITKVHEDMIDKMYTDPEQLHYAIGAMKSLKTFADNKDVDNKEKSVDQDDIEMREALLSMIS